MTDALPLTLVSPPRDGWRNNVALQRTAVINHTVLLPAGVELIRCALRRPPQRTNESAGRSVLSRRVLCNEAAFFSRMSGSQGDSEVKEIRH